MPEWLAQRARLSPARRALRIGERWLSFAELDGLVAITRDELTACGVTRGDRVAVLARNGLPLVRVLHALPRLGAIAVPLHPRWTAHELAIVLDDCAPSLLICDEEATGPDATGPDATEPDATEPDAVTALPSTAPHVHIDTVTASPSRPPIDSRSADVARIALSDVHTIVYTSGTTGGPKGVELTFGNHLWSAIGSALNLGVREDDCWLACLPLCHVGGLAVLTRSLIYGMPVILHERFDPGAIASDIDEGKVTIISVVGTMLQRLLADRPVKRRFPPTLRCVLLGGGPVSDALLRACVQRGIPVVQTYGLTEAASQVTTLAPADAAGRLGSAGKPLFPTEIRISQDGSDRGSPGDIGEVLVRGPTVMRGYHGRPDATGTALRDGWLHTGDLGYVDADGYLYIRDRRDGLIVSGGENVYASEVEDALRAHPAVTDAGVIGVPDDQWGQVVVATVSVSAGATISEEDLIAFSRERLAPFKVPKRIRFTAILPRTASGKLLRRALHDANDPSP
jgi:O-succinylbenzoic acid--CoA ligase